MWFSYMMLFFQAVLNMRAAVAGAMLLLGTYIITEQISHIYVLVGESYY